MCRLLAYVGPPIALDALLVAPEHSLVVQSYAPAQQRFGTINADGWGVGWYDPATRAEPARYRTAAPMWSDDAFLGIAPFIRSGHVMACVRSATPPAPSEATGVAPFEWGRFLFAHNGMVDDFRGSSGVAVRDLASPLRRNQLVGASDSEVLFAIVLTRLDEGASPAEALTSTIRDVRRCAPARLNLMLSDGDELLASTCGDTLFVIDDREAIALASEPTDGRSAWTAVDDGRLVRVSGGRYDVSELA